MMGGDPIAPCSRTDDKRTTAAQHARPGVLHRLPLIAQNRAAVENIAETLIERKEMHGDEVVELLGEAGLKPADMQYVEERTWPRP